MRVNSKIYLEAIGLSMAPVIFETIDRDRNYLRQWLPFVDITREVADTEMFIKSMLIEKNGMKDEVFTIWYNMEFAGLIGFKDTDWVNNKTELGYWLAESMQGNGIVTQCTERLIRYAFKKLDMNRIQIKVAVGNEKSAAIPHRLGFQFEGIERHGEWIDGTYHDLQVFSLLRNDKKR